MKCLPLFVILLVMLFPSMAGAGERWLGVHHGFDNDQLPLERQLQQAASLGVEVVRVGVSWANLQPTEAEIGSRDDDRSFIRRTDANAWHIDELDRIVAAALARGLRIVMLVAEAPCWANTRGPDCTPDTADHHWYPPRPERVDDFARAAAWLVHRYREAPVVAWEIWNEPNTTTFWKSAGLRPGTFVLAEPAAARDYVRLLNATYRRLKAIDRSLVILGGSLAGADQRYLEAMYRHRPEFDALALHPYNKARPGTTRTEWPEVCRSDEDPLQPPWCFAAVPDIRALMVAAGDEDKHIWLTEFGAAAVDPQGFDDTGGEAGQGEYLARALTMINSWCYVKAALAYRLYDQPATGDTMGLFRADGTLKSAGAALRAANLERWHRCPG